MKKILFLTICIIFIFACTTAQTIHYLTEADISWEAVTILSDGSPIFAEDTILYEVWLRDTAFIVTLLMTVSTTTYHLVLPGLDTYIVGIKTKRIAQGGEVTYSGINWSDMNGVYTPIPFVYAHPSQQIPPKAPLGLSTE